jgi:ubiquinone/menaquinone biosynthesis C-methylase UbiE
MHMADYLMDSDGETLRLEMKTRESDVQSQAMWAGIKPGMRVADIGCGSGKTTALLHGLVKPDGKVVGVDSSSQRLSFARQHYGRPGIQFECRDIREPLDDLGMFDFIWVRFVLEYFLSNGFDVVKNINRIVKPGGILCLIDLDYNCLTHYDLPVKLESAMGSLFEKLRDKANFDPYAGRKLYSHLYALNYTAINIKVDAHHLIYGDLKEIDALNWIQKLEVASRKVDHTFEELDGGYEEFRTGFKSFLSNPGRFSYSPLISCRGQKSCL